VFAPVFDEVTSWYLPVTGNASSEDDGWLLSFVYEPRRDASDLVIVDAAELTTQAVIELPTRVPFGFHGTWVQGDPR